MTARVRSIAGEWVDCEERRTGSRMVAYRNVGSMVGASAEWMRKFLRGDEAKTPDWIVGWNILDTYERLINRVEQDNDNKLALIAALKAEKDAVATCGLDERHAAPEAVAHERKHQGG